MKRRSIGVRLLAACLGLLGTSALYGGGALVVDPSGSLLRMPLELLAGTPFETYLIPGATLLVVFGIGSTVALYGICCRASWMSVQRLNPVPGVHWAWTASCALGAGLVVWIAVQVALIGYVSLLQPLYGLLGIVLLILSFLPSVRKDLCNRGPD